eukprot:403347480
MLPHPNIPWSKPSSSYRLLELLVLLANSIFLGLVDLLIKTASHYVQNSQTSTNSANSSNSQHLEYEPNPNALNLDFYIILLPLLGHNDHETTKLLNTLVHLSLFRENDKESFTQIRSLIYRHRYICSDRDLCPSLMNKYELIKEQNLAQNTQIVQQLDQETPGLNYAQTLKQDHEGEQIFMDQNDLKMGYSSQFILKTLFDTLFYHARTEISHSDISLLEIFIKIFHYNQIISSYYKLLEIKPRLTTTSEKQKFRYLHNMIVYSYQCTEKKHEEYDVEKVMKIESEFIKYKQCILEVTMQVQKFWQGLCNKHVELPELMLIGSQIVQTYMTQKDCYENLLRMKPEFAEVALYYVQFCQNVMNFEIEALEANNLYKKIIDKQKVLQRNFYNLAKKDFALVIVCNKNGKKNQVIMVNQIFEEATGIPAIQVINKNVNQIIPMKIGEFHDRLLQNYLNTYNGLPYNRLFERVWLKKFDDTVLPIRAQVLTCLSSNHGLIMVALVESAPPIQIGNITYKSSQAYFLLADDEGLINNASPNFTKKYFASKDSLMLDYRFTIKDIFPFIDEFESEDLLNGVQTKMNLQFYRCQTYLNPLDKSRFLDVKVRIITHKFKLKISIQEIIFIENFTSSLNIIVDNADQTGLSEENQGMIIDDDLSEYMGENNMGSVAYFQSQLIRGRDNNVVSHGSASASSESSNTENQKGLLQIKNMLDFKKLPQSLVNLKRAIILFFMVMMATAIAMLTVTLVSHHEFHGDQETTKNCIFINRELANLRLSFRMLVFIAQRGNNSVFLTYDDQIYHLGEFFKNLQSYQNQLIDDDQGNAQIKNLTSTNALVIEELQIDGSITKTHSTYISGMQQFLSKVSYFLERSESQLIQIFQNFDLKKNLKNMTDEQRDAWFVIQNSNNNIRDFTIELMDLYLYHGMGQEDGYRQTLLIIVCLCVAITIISTIILTPTASNLDEEELNVIHKWNEISDQVKFEVLEKIEVFNTWMSKVDADRTKIHEIAFQVKHQVNLSKQNVSNLNESDCNKSNSSSMTLNHNKKQGSKHQYFHQQKRSGELNSFGLSNDADSHMNMISFYDSVNNDTSNAHLKELETIQELPSTRRNLVDSLQRQQSPVKDFSSSSLQKQSLNQYNNIENVQTLNYNSGLNLFNQLSDVQNTKSLNQGEDKFKSSQQLDVQKRGNSPLNKNLKHRGSFKLVSNNKLKQVTSMNNYSNFSHLAIDNDKNLDQIMDPIQDQGFYQKQKKSTFQKTQNVLAKTNQQPQNNNVDENDQFNSVNLSSKDIQEKREPKNGKIQNFQGLDESYFGQDKSQLDLLQTSGVDGNRSFDYQQYSSQQSFMRNKQIKQDEREQFENGLNANLKRNQFGHLNQEQIKQQKRQKERLDKNNIILSQSDNSSQFNNARDLSGITKKSQIQENITKNDDPKTKKQQFDSKVIKKIFRIIKIKRILLFAVLNVVIILFFIGQYLITDQVIREASDSFMQQYVFSERIACLTTSLNLVQETFADNQTQILGFENKTLLDFMLQNCGDIENQVLEYERNYPPQMVYMKDQLKGFDSAKSCNLMFGDDQFEVDNCYSKINRVMDGGMRTAIAQIYYHAINEMLYFNSIDNKAKTTQLLRDRIYKSKTQEFMDLVFDVIMPMSYELGEQVDESIDVYLDDVLDKYFTLFGVFLGFLALTLFLIFRYALIVLRNIVMRTRVLIKIIPIEELKKIIDRKKAKNIREMRGNNNLYFKN